jgi:hypothetical protein
MLASVPCVTGASCEMLDAGTHAYAQCVPPGDPCNGVPSTGACAGGNLQACSLSVDGAPQPSNVSCDNGCSTLDAGYAAVAFCNPSAPCGTVPATGVCQSNAVGWSVEVCAGDGMGNMGRETLPCPVQWSCSLVNGSAACQP